MFQHDPLGSGISASDGCGQMPNYGRGLTRTDGCSPIRNFIVGRSRTRARTTPFGCRRDLAAEREELLQLRGELEALKAEIKFRQLLRDSKAYNPSQPRVPAGNPEGGQWTGEGGVRCTRRRHISPPGFAWARDERCESGREHGVGSVCTSRQ
jgi:hypothetical protein